MKPNYYYLVIAIAVIAIAFFSKYVIRPYILSGEMSNKKIDKAFILDFITGFCCVIIAMILLTDFLLTCLPTETGQ